MNIALLFLMILISVNDCDQMQSVRDDYHTIRTEEQLKGFIEKLEQLNCEMARPYLASATMQKAEFSLWPTDKLRYFKKGKNMLEDFISAHPENIEAKYVRLLVQSELPGFLGYKDQIEPDAAFIKSQIGLSDLPKKYQHVILENVESILKKHN